MLDAERRRIGVRVYDDETRALAVEAVGAGFTMREAAELAGCSRRAVSDWCRAAGVEPARKKPVYLPYEEKMELVARYEAGERAADLAAEAGVTGPAVTGWARRLREEGALSLMTEGDVRARVPEPAEPPSELEALRRRCEELELENAILAGTVEILKKDPGADPSALTAAERAALAESLRAEFGLPRVLAALSLASVSVNLFFTSFAKQARRSRKGGFTGCANVFSPIPVTARRGRPSAGPSACRTCRLS